jgi:hypothetical protein
LFGDQIRPFFPDRQFIHPGELIFRISIGCEVNAIGTDATFDLPWTTDVLSDFTEASLQSERIKFLTILLLKHEIFSGLSK